MGDSTVSTNVLADGSVDDIQLVGRATDSMDNFSVVNVRNATGSVFPEGEETFVGSQCPDAGAHHLSEP